MDIKKLTAVLGYIIEQLGSVTKLHVVKLLYFIDKEHLIKYGRFVTNDVYKKYPYGPVPSTILNIINNSTDVLFDDEKKFFLSYINIANDRNRTMSNKLEPDLDELSKSEIKIIKDVVKKYGKLDTRHLVNLSHKEVSWLNAKDYDDLKVEDMISELPEDERKELLNHLKQERDTDKFLDLFCA